MMNKSLMAAIVTVGIGGVCLLIAGVASAAAPATAPASEAAGATFEWTSSAPEAQGMDAAKLDALWDGLKRAPTNSLLIVRNDRIVYERYTEGWDANKPHSTASLAKALVGGMSLMLAMDQGLIAPNDPASKYCPQWKDDAEKARITIRHLATHTSGIEDSTITGVAHKTEPGWKGEFWRMEPDPFTVSRDKAPVVSSPGGEFRYSNPGMAMLAYTVTASLRDAQYKDLRTLLRERLMQPIGVEARQWPMGYGKTYPVDGMPMVPNWGGASYTPRATARVGRFLLRKGDWEGRQLVRPEVVSQCTTEGLGWFTNKDAVHPQLPADAFWGQGAGHQTLLVVPSLNLIVVRYGQSLDGAGFAAAATTQAARAVNKQALNRVLFAPLMEAVAK